MKKKLEAELLSIAHRVLKLTGKDDVIQLQQEAHKLYEKLSILRFYEENIATLQTEISAEKLEEKLTSFSFDTPKKAKIITQEASSKALATPLSEPLLNEELVAVIEAVKDNKQGASEGAAEETSPKESVFSPSFELSVETDDEEVLSSKEPKPESKQISLEDFLNEDYTEPEFVKKESVTEEVSKSATLVFEKTESESGETTKTEITKTEIVTTTTASKSNSLNDTLLKGISIGLNDRIAFVKHLFGGSNEDFNRVTSQLNTFDSFEDAQNFVEDMVKPDYKNWEGKEEYSVRFMNLVEKKFT